MRGTDADQIGLLHWKHVGCLVAVSLDMSTLFVRLKLTFPVAFDLLLLYCGRL